MADIDEKCASSDRRRRWPWLSSVLSLLAFGLCGLPDEIVRALALARSAVEAGELWRLWTGHFTHFGWTHALPDVLAFGLWAGCLEVRSRRALVLAVTALAPLLSLLVFYTEPLLEQYRGLSGVDAMLLAGLGMTLLLDARLRRWHRLAILGLGFAIAAKGGWDALRGETFWGVVLGEEVTVVYAAHGWGAVFGAAFAVALRVIGRGGSDVFAGRSLEGQRGASLRS